MKMVFCSWNDCMLFQCFDLLKPKIKCFKSSSHFLWKDLHLWKPYLIRRVAAIAWIVLKRMRELLPTQHFHLEALFFLGRVGRWALCLFPGAIVIYIIPMFKTLQPQLPYLPNHMGGYMGTLPLQTMLSILRSQVAGIQAVHLQR